MAEEKKEMEVVNGVYSLNTVDEQMKYASFMISKRLVSDTFKEPAQLMVAIQLCKDLGLPNSCLKDFYVIGGKPAIFGDTFVALALGSGVIAEHQINFYDESGEDISLPRKGDKLFSCVVTGRRSGSSLTSSISFSMDDLASSGNNNPNFKKHPRDMLYRRAMGRFIKWICADAIRGVEMADYAEESLPPLRNDPLIDLQQAAREDADRMRLEQVPKEELEIGPLYRFQNSIHRGKQLWEVPIIELEQYLAKLKKRPGEPKTWERELVYIIETYISNIENYKEMIMELEIERGI